jgi:hypothetical protein
VKIRDEAAAKAKADAIKAGKTEAEADVLGKIAGLEAENAFLNGEVQTGITERQTLKTALKDAEPFVAKGKAAAEGEKTAAEQLAEVRAEREKDRQALVSERRDSRLRGALAKAGVRADRMDAAVRLVDTKGLTYDEAAGTFAGLDEAAGTIAKSYPEFVGEQRTGSPGNDQAGRGNGNTIKSEDLVAGDDVAAFDANRAGIKAGKNSLA